MSAVEAVSNTAPVAKSMSGLLERSEFSVGDGELLLSRRLLDARLHRGVGAGIWQGSCALINLCIMRCRICNLMGN